MHCLRLLRTNPKYLDLKNDEETKFETFAFSLYFYCVNKCKRKIETSIEICHVVGCYNVYSNGNRSYVKN